MRPRKIGANGLGGEHVNDRAEHQHRGNPEDRPDDAGFIRWLLKRVGRDESPSKRCDGRCGEGRSATTRSASGALDPDGLLLGRGTVGDIKRQVVKSGRLTQGGTVACRGRLLEFDGGGLAAAGPPNLYGLGPGRIGGLNGFIRDLVGGQGLFQRDARGLAFLGIGLLLGLLLAFLLFIVVFVSRRAANLQGLFRRGGPAGATGFLRI